MDLSRTHGSVSPIPDWLVIQGLTEEVLQAAVTELGIEILGALCARAEPAPVRLRLCSLAARKFTTTMYAELCHHMEMYCVRPQSKWTILRGSGKYAEEMGGDGFLQIKTEDNDFVDPEREGINPEHVQQEKLVGKFSCSLCSRKLTTKAALKRHMKKHQPVSGNYQ
uniref:uncharacterized protein isoform X2 n=1 Tax=Myxine glutinosa TaxID=7769 RepID=UPI0035902D2C